jgi:hypothetical protein
MVLKARNAFIPMMGIALALQAGGCKKDKDSKTDLLVGEWEITKLDGAAPDYKTTFEFEKDKDMKLCLTEPGTIDTYCYTGDWDWTSSDEDELEINWNDSGDTYTIGITVESLTKDELVGELTSDGDTYDIVLEKI